MMLYILITSLKILLVVVLLFATSLYLLSPQGYHFTTRWKFWPFCGFHHLQLVAVRCSLRNSCSLFFIRKKRLEARWVPLVARCLHNKALECCLANLWSLGFWDVVLEMGSFDSPPMSSYLLPIDTHGLLLLFLSYFARTKSVSTRSVWIRWQLPL